jgi:hypothetical protein
MIAKTPTRPPLLSSKIARNNLLPAGLQGDGAVIPLEVASTLSTIDRLASIWDGLDAVRTTADPTATKEANALSYKRAYEQATATATATVRTTADALLTARNKARHDAYGKSGLLADYGNKAALQSVLRSMKQSQRDAAISHAIETADHEVMAAIHNAHSLLIGETTLPLATLVAMHVERKAPEEAARVATIDKAIEHLDLAYGQFAHSAEKMRDRQAEADGEAGAKLAREAAAKLALAVSDLQPGAS